MGVIIMKEYPKFIARTQEDNLYAILEEKDNKLVKSGQINNKNLKNIKDLSVPVRLVVSKTLRGR